MEKIFLNNLTIKQNKFYCNKIYSFLELLEDEYPDFKKWYFSRVFSKNYDLINRSIIIKTYKKEICAVSIMKHNEEKICTFRVSEKFQGLHIGTDLMTETINLLGTNKPLITISEDRINQFNSILNHFDFNLYDIYNSYYIKNKKEFSYNKPIENCNKEVIISGVF